MRMFLILCCVTFVGCGVKYLEDRFDHSHLGNSLRISKVTVVEADTVVFEFKEKELEKLEEEIGRMSWSDTTIDDQNKSLKPTGKELNFSFSDGFQIQVDHVFGTINGTCILVIELSDDNGFGGVTEVFVSLSDVLDGSRLDEIKNVLVNKNKVPETNKNKVSRNVRV